MKKQMSFLFSLIFCLLFFCSCGSAASSPEEGPFSGTDSSKQQGGGARTETALIEGNGSRGSTPSDLQPSAGGRDIYENEAGFIDYSNCGEGYFMIQYLGDCPKVKLQLTGPDNITYTYNLTTEMDAFPLSAGSGSYMVGIYENISGNQYATALSTEITADITNSFGPFLYPNQYVTFTQENEACRLAAQLAETTDSDLDVISNVYNYIIANITYDYEKAENIESGYIPDVDSVLTEKKGICLDYSCLMAAMLRSQRIPTQVEVGYAGDVYHAWISIYVADVGWVNGIIQFDGRDWQLMDPTTAAGNGDEALQKFIGDGSNYVTKYIY